MKERLAAPAAASAVKSRASHVRQFLVALIIVVTLSLLRLINGWHSTHTGKRRRPAHSHLSAAAACRSRRLRPSVAHSLLIKTVCFWRNIHAGLNWLTAKQLARPSLHTTLLAWGSMSSTALHSECTSIGCKSHNTSTCSRVLWLVGLQASGRRCVAAAAAAAALTFGIPVCIFIRCPPSARHISRLPEMNLLRGLPPTLPMELSCAVRDQ